MLKTYLLSAAAAMQFVLLSAAYCQTIPDPVATVDGKNISSAELIEQSVMQAGREILQNLIESQIVLQWAAQEGVAPTDEQMNRQISMLQREGIYADQVRVMGENRLKEEIRELVARVNLAKKLETITDEELENSYQQMKSRYVHGPRKQIALILNSDKAKVEEAAKKIKEGMDFETAAVQYSDPNYSRGTAVKVWAEEDQVGMPESVIKATKETEVGEVSDVIQVDIPDGQTQYVILKVIQEQPKSDLKFEQVKEEIRDTVAMQKAQSSREFQKKFDERRKNAQIDIKMSRFADVVGLVKTPRPPMMMPPTNMPGEVDSEFTGTGTR